MKKLILGALALAFVSSATLADAKTWTFDLFTTTTTYGPGSFTPIVTYTNQGSGTFSFTGQTTTMANAKANEPTFSVYEPVTFDLNLDFTNWAWTDRELTIGRVRVQRVPGAVPCVITPGGCVPGTPLPPTNSIFVDFVGGTFNVRSPEVLAVGDLNLSQSNIDRVFSNATGGNMTLVQTSPYGVPSGANLQLMNVRELVAAPVPEPGEWAMIAAGLAIVGGVARRRKSA